MARELIIVFDGVCNLCESSVNFVMRRDKSRKFKFAPAQGQVGNKLQSQYNIKALDLETMILIKDGIAYTRSDAAIEVSKNLDGAWKGLVVMKIIPKILRDWAYTLIAKNRYKWFGQKDVCILPSLDIKSRFLE